MSFTVEVAADPALVAELKVTALPTTATEAAVEAPATTTAKVTALPAVPGNFAYR